MDHNKSIGNVSIVVTNKLIWGGKIIYVYNKLENHNNHCGHQINIILSNVVQNVWCGPKKTLVNISDVKTICENSESKDL